MNDNYFGKRRFVLEKLKSKYEGERMKPSKSRSAQYVAE